MAQPQTPRLDTSIGTGEAQIFQQPSNAETFQGIGQQLGMRSEGAQRKKREALTREELANLNDLPIGGMLEGLATRIYDYRDHVRKTATSPEFHQKFKGGEAVGQVTEMTSSVKFYTEQFKELSKNMNQIFKKAASGNSDEWVGFNKLQRFMDGQDFPEKEEGETQEEYNGRVLAEGQVIVANVYREEEYSLDPYLAGINTSEEVVKSIRGDKTVETSVTRVDEEDVLNKSKVFNAFARKVELGEEKGIEYGVNGGRASYLLKQARDRIFNNPELQASYEVANDEVKKEIEDRESARILTELMDAQSKDKRDTQPYKDKDKGKGVEIEYNPDNIRSKINDVKTSEGVSMGAKKAPYYPLNGKQQADVTIGLGEGRKAKGKITRLTLDDEGNNVFIVQYEVDSGDKEDAKKVIKEKIVSQSEVEEDIPNDIFNQYIKVFDGMKEEGVNSLGFKKGEVSKVEGDMENLADGVFNKEDEALELATELFTGYVEIADDPTGLLGLGDSDDISMSFFGGGNVSYDLNKEIGRRKFTEISTGVRIAKDNGLSIEDIQDAAKVDNKSIENYLIDYGKQKLKDKKEGKNNTKSQTGGLY